jgi:hypothetical protein
MANSTIILGHDCRPADRPEPKTKYLVECFAYQTIEVPPEVVARRAADAAPPSERDRIYVEILRAAAGRTEG